MNSYEALLLRPEAARGYLAEVYTNITTRYADVMPVELADITIAISESLADIDAGDSDPNEVLSEVIESMDDLDCDDYFGTQGWRYFLMGED